MFTINVFLASSSELEQERRAFEVFIRRKNDNFTPDFYIKLNIWESFIDSISKTSLQDEYNKTIKNCDIFILLYFSKVGKYTEEEFSVAFGNFKENNTPRVYTYKKVPKSGNFEVLSKEYISVLNFDDKIKMLGHFITTYDSIEELTNHFWSQIEKIYPVIENTKKRHNKNHSEPNIQRPKDLTKFEVIAKDEIIGRETELQEIHNTLFDDKKVIIVNGLGGIGKTMLAQAYASIYYDKYKYIAWVTQGDEPAIKAFINNKELIKNLGLDYSELSRFEENEQIKRILTKHSDITDKPNLLVIDNSDKTICDIKQYLPGKPNWHVLITSREEIGIERNCVNKKLDFLSEEKAFELFNKHCLTKIYSEKQIYALLKTIEYHTLTIEILAKTAELRWTPFEKILHALEDDLKTSIPVSRETKQIERVTTYLKSIFNFTKLDDNEIWILKQFCFLPPNYHSSDIIEILLQINKLSWYEEFYMALNTLVKKGWLLYNREKKSFKMHRIIYEVAIAKIPPSYQDVQLLFQKIAELLYSEEDVDNYLEHTEWIPFGENILELINKYEAFKQFEINSEIYTIQKNIGWLYDETDEKEKGKIVLEKALNSSINVLGFENTFVTDCRSKLAMILIKLDESDKSKTLIEQVIETDLKILDKGNPLLALHQNNLAVIYSSIGDNKKALDLMYTVIESEIKNFGDKAARIAVRYFVLAGIYSELDEHNKAIEYFEKSLNIYKLHFPTNHPTIANVLYSLGICYFFTDKQKAKEALERAFDIYSAHFKENSDKVSQAEYILGLLYITEIKNKKDDVLLIEKACSFLERALATRKENEGVDSLLVAQIQYFLGFVLYHAKQEKEKAVNILDEALRTRVKKLGESHEDVATIQYELGEIYFDLNKNEKAKELLEHALKIRVERYGLMHEDVLEVQMSLGTVYTALNEYQKAKELYEIVLSYYQSTLEPNDQKIGNIQFILGRIYSETDEHEKAKEHYEASLAIHIKNYGEDHQQTILLQSELGSVFYQLDNKEKAIELYEIVLSYYQSTLEPNDQKIGDIQFILGRIYSETDEHEKAKEHYEASSAIYIINYGKDHQQTILVQSELASVFYQLDEKEKAVELFEIVLSYYQSTLEPNDQKIGDIQFNIGRIYSETDEPEKAKEHYEASLAIHIKNYGEDHQETALVLYKLAWIYYQLDEKEKAIELYYKTLQFYSNQQEPNKQFIVAIQQELGHIYAALNENQKAKELYEIVLHYYQSTLEPNDQKIGDIQFNIGRIYSETGELEKAKELYEESLAIHINNYGEDHQETALIKYFLGCVYHKLEAENKAFKILNEAKSVALNKLGEDAQLTKKIEEILDKIIINN